MRTPVLAVLAACSLSACATAPRSGPVDVLRYHLDTVARGTASVQPASAADEVGVDYRAYADAIGGELTRVGYPAPAAGASAQYLATVAVRRVSRGMVERPSPFSIGIGGGSFGGGRRGGGVGIGGGVSFPVGRGRTSEIVGTELSVQIRERGGSVIWEGRATTEGEAQVTEETAARLASALFRGFPGESGRTITVR